MLNNVEYLYELAGLERENEFKIATVAYIEKKVIDISEQEKIQTLNSILYDIEKALKINDVIHVIDLIEHKLEKI